MECSLSALGSVLTPCNFPTPTTEAGFGERCMAYVELPYLCDLDGTMSRSAAEKIDDLVSVRFARELEGDGGGGFGHPMGRVPRSGLRAGIGIAMLRRLPLPKALPTADSVHASPASFCLLGQGLPSSPPQSWNRSQILSYASTYADIVRRRWFGSDCGAHVLILAAAEGAGGARDARRPVVGGLVEVALGGQLLALLGPDEVASLREWTSEATLRGFPVETVMEEVVRRVGERVEELNERGRRKAEHAVPAWAVQMGAAALGLTLFALGLDYLIVRSKGLSLTSRAATDEEEKHRKRILRNQIRLQRDRSRRMYGSPLAFMSGQASSTDRKVFTASHPMGRLLAGHVGRSGKPAPSPSSVAIASRRHRSRFGGGDSGGGGGGGGGEKRRTHMYF